MRRSADHSICNLPVVASVLLIAVAATARFGYTDVACWIRTVIEHPRIEINPDVMMGKPVIRGTRLTVELILRMLAVGHTIDDLLDSYPRLTRDDVFAAQAFAAEHLRQAFVQAAE